MTNDTNSAETTTDVQDLPLVTTLSRGWVLRMVVMMVAAFGLGLWGLYDATVAYPNRGIKSSERFELDYLKTAEENVRLSSAGVSDPAAELERLRTLRSKPTALDEARFKWLETLSIIGRLDASFTAFPREGDGADTGASDPRARLAYLSNKWNTQTAPKPLAKYDLLMQWGIFGIGCGIGLGMVLYVVRVSRAKYRWDPDEQRLTLPGGKSFATDDVEIFDRRKWHKFIMFATIKPDHAELGGRELKFDLLKFTPLEPWILEMEAIVSPPEEDEPTDEPVEAEA